MAQGAFFRDDVVLSKQTDQNNAYLIIPQALESVPIDDLRRDDTDTVVDGKTLTAFFIDDNGLKHASNFAPGALKLNRTVTLNRRGGANKDRFERGSGSFITDGFQVGDWVSVDGSVSNDRAYKIATVAALNMEIDDAIVGFDVDETSVAVTLHTGWQRIEIAWTDKLKRSAEGLWEVKSNQELRREARSAFSLDLSHYVDNEVAVTIPAQAPGYSERRAGKQFISAMADLRRDSPDSPTWGELQDDLNTRAKTIFDEVEASNTGLTVTFNAAQNRIERTAGDWAADGYLAGMEVWPDGSTSNDKAQTNGGWVIKNVTALNLKVVDEDSLTQEASVSVDLLGRRTLTGYKKWRADDEQWGPAVNKNDLGDFMEEAIVVEWYARIRKDQSDYFRNVKSADIWAASTAYAVDDYVFDPLNCRFYRCNEAHTSGTARVDDDSKWDWITPQGITLTAFPTAQLEIE